VYDGLVRFGSTGGLEEGVNEGFVELISDLINKTFVELIKGVDDFISWGFVYGILDGEEIGRDGAIGWAEGVDKEVRDLEFEAELVS